MTPTNEIQTRANAYADSRTLFLEDTLGFGFDGIVYSTNLQSAVKVFRHEQLYRRERDVYFRLRDHRVIQVLGFKVPNLSILTTGFGSLR